MFITRIPAYISVEKKYIGLYRVSHKNNLECDSLFVCVFVRVVCVCVHTCP